uniref:Uncharacterized protein n=1 Tax=Rhizophora mucronata TaxID=61149 RepID=A0A2P2J3W9_RHIMU
MQWKKQTVQTVKKIVMGKRTILQCAKPSLHIPKQAIKIKNFS